jgi:uncharacterized protein
MIFEDAKKNRANIRKHGLDFADAAEIFRSALVVEPEIREDYGEKRWRGIGMTRGRTAVVIFTERSSEIIRIISLRKANHEERKEYEETIANGLEEN